MKRIKKNALKTVQHRTKNRNNGRVVNMIELNRLLASIILIFFICTACGAGGDLVDSVVNNLNIKIGNHGFELTQANNVQRQELIQRVCERQALANGAPSTNGAAAATTTTNPMDELNGIPDEQLQHLLIDEKHKFLYCYVPKVSAV